MNSVWGVTKNRNYLHNQLVSFTLAFAVGALAMISVALSAGQQSVAGWIFFGTTDNLVFRLFASWFLHIVGGLTSILIFFLIYWALPNRKVPARAVLPTAIAIGPAVGDRKVPLHQGPSLAGLPVGLWSLLHFGRPHDVGLSLRTAAACRSSLLRDALHLVPGARSRAGGLTEDGESVPPAVLSTALCILRADSPVRPSGSLSAWRFSKFSRPSPVDGGVSSPSFRCSRPSPFSRSPSRSYCASSARGCFGACAAASSSPICSSVSLPVVLGLTLVAIFAYFAAGQFSIHLMETRLTVVDDRLRGRNLDHPRPRLSRRRSRCFRGQFQADERRSHCRT